jgi:subtilase family serine protease
MHRTTLRLGFLAAMMAVVVGGAAFLAGAPKAQACTNGIPCYVVALPDLRVTNIDADPLSNGETRIEFWVKNEGTANSSGGMYRVDIAGVGVWWGVLGSVTKGATKYYSFDITSPPTPPNSRLVQVCADATSKVTELNEANNCLQKDVVFNQDILPA